MKFKIKLNEIKQNFQKFYLILNLKKICLKKIKFLN
jgi:hypothetical protein